MSDADEIGTPADTTHRSPGVDHTAVELEVTFDTDGEPSEINFFHNLFGMMKLAVEDGVATIDEEWDRLGDGYLKEEHTRWISTGDVLRSVENLQFIDEVQC